MARMRSRVSNILIVDEDLWDGKLRDRHHASRLAGIKTRAELAGPKQGVEKAAHHSAADLFFHTLQPSSTSEEFLKSKAFAVRDDVVVGEYHKARGEIDASIQIGRDHDFLEEKLHLFSTPADFGHVNCSYTFVEAG